MQYNFFKNLATVFAAAIVALPALAQGLVVTGGNLVMADTGKLVIDKGRFTNNGSFIPAKGTVFFTGNDANTFITSTTPLAFHNLTISKQANDVTLNSNVSLDGLLKMVNGNLQLNNYTLDLGVDVGSIAGETETAHVIGNISIKSNLNYPTAANPGNIGIEITSAANLGITEIKRGHVQPISPTGGKGILRYYDIIPANNTALNASIKFYYLDDELAGINKTELALFESNDNGGTWIKLGKDDSDIVHDWVFKTGINTLNRFALASATHNALPLTLLYFEGQKIGGQDVLYWSTQNELNTSHFDIERSGDGISFKLLGTVASKGNNVNTQYYQFADAKPITGTNYYRLKQVDKNGRFTYSNVVTLKAETLNKLVQLFPNPARNKATVIFYSEKEQDCVVDCFDAAGKLVGHQLVHVQPGVNNLNLDVSRYAAGTYSIKFENMNMQTLKLLKQ